MKMLLKMLPIISQFLWGVPLTCGTVLIWTSPFPGRGGWELFWQTLGCGFEGHFDGMPHFPPQVGVHLWEGIPVHRHGGELRLQQNERGGLHQHQRHWEDLGCGWLRLSIAGWWLTVAYPVWRVSGFLHRALTRSQLTYCHFGSHSVHLNQTMWANKCRAESTNHTKKKKQFSLYKLYGQLSKIQSAITVIIWQWRCIPVSSKVIVSILKKPKQTTHQKEIVPELTQDKGGSPEKVVRRLNKTVHVCVRLRVWTARQSCTLLALIRHNKKSFVWRLHFLLQTHFLCPHGSPASPDYLQVFKRTREYEFSHHTPPGGRL